jgi:hypothetical protein
MVKPTRALGLSQPSMPVAPPPAFMSTRELPMLTLRSML